MPIRVELRELGCLEIGGVALSIGLARGGRVVMFIGQFDADGLLETQEDCRAAARRFHDKLDHTGNLGDIAD